MSSEHEDLIREGNDAFQEAEGRQQESAFPHELRRRARTEKILLDLSHQMQILEGEFERAGRKRKSRGRAKGRMVKMRGNHKRDQT